MNKLLFFSLLIVFAFSCKKENQNQKPVSSVIGNWELRAEYGGIAGSTSHFPPGNGSVLNLTADSTFKLYEQSALVNQGTFSIIKNGIVMGQQKFDGIFYNHDTAGFPIQLKADTLTIGIDFDDEIVSVYVRK